MDTQPPAGKDARPRRTSKGLTDAALRALRPKAARYEVGDRDGLLLEVHPSGKMTWRYRYMRNGRREKVTLGPYPGLGLRDARDRRLEAERLVLAGKSPAQERRRERATEEMQTVADLAERWIEEVLRKANKNAEQDETYLRRDLLPRIGRMRPAEVTTADVRACVDPVLKRGHGQAARRVRNVAKRLFEYGEGFGLLRGNPAAVLRPVHIAPTVSRQRVLSDAEIPGFLRTIYTSRLSRPFKLVLHFLLLVPARKGELVEARWEQFDLEAGTWDIPKEASKNGAPIRHKLPRQALALARELRDLASEGSPWVLPSNRNLGKAPFSKSALNAALRAVEGLPEGLVIHDLRRTVRTGLSELGGIPTEVAELCLNHRPQGVAGVYDRAERIEERAVALQRWADYLDGLQAGGSNVVPFRQSVA